MAPTPDLGWDARSGVNVGARTWAARWAASAPGAGLIASVAFTSGANGVRLGTNGALVGYNFGADPERPMRHVFIRAAHATPTSGWQATAGTLVYGNHEAGVLVLSTGSSAGSGAAWTAASLSPQPRTILRVDFRPTIGPLFYVDAGAVAGTGPQSPAMSVGTYDGLWSATGSKIALGGRPDSGAWTAGFYKQVRFYQSAMTDAEATAVVAEMMQEWP